MGNNRPDDVLAVVPDGTAAGGADFLWPYCHWVGDGAPEARLPGPGQAISDPDIPLPASLARQPQPSAEQAAQRCAGGRGLT